MSNRLALYANDTSTVITCAKNQRTEPHALSRHAQHRAKSDKPTTGKPSPWTRLQSLAGLLAGDTGRASAQAGRPDYPVNRMIPVSRTHNERTTAIAATGHARNHRSRPHAPSRPALHRARTTSQRPDNRARTRSRYSVRLLERATRAEPPHMLSDQRPQSQTELPISNLTSGNRILYRRRLRDAGQLYPSAAARRARATIAVGADSESSIPQQDGCVTINTARSTQLDDQA